MTTTPHTPSPTEKLILARLPDGMQLDRPIPFEAAFQAISPAIQFLQASQAPALPLFLRWLDLRQTDLTLRQAVFLWDNFFLSYVRDLPRLQRTWGHRGSNAPVSGIGRFRLVTDILVQKHFLASERHLAQSRFGTAKLWAWRLVGGTFVLLASILFHSYLFEKLASA